MLQFLSQYVVSISYTLLSVSIGVAFLFWFACKQNKQLKIIKRHMTVVRNLFPLFRKINFFSNFGLRTLIDVRNKGGSIQFMITHLASSEAVLEMRVYMITTQENLSLHEAISKGLTDIEYVERIFNDAIEYYLDHGSWKLSNE
jgi:hypothetical protein